MCYEIYVNDLKLKKNKRINNTLNINPKSHVKVKRFLYKIDGSRLNNVDARIFHIP
jgi:hypothetical protein